MPDLGFGHRHKLVAIDGNSLLYRAFFAVKHLSTSSGVPTNAVYGFTMMLLRIIQEEKPDSMVVAFDAPALTFRHEAYDGYKAQRKPTPDELKAQGPIARTMVEAFRIPIIEIPGFEADDVVGTIARQSREHDYDTLIVTGDLDALQLVNDCVKVMTTIKGVTDTVIYDAQAVEDRYGIAPAQMADFKALKGDPSDNIPGVRGVGDKTAEKLIKQFGTVEAIYERVDEVADEKLRRKLIDSRADAEMSKHLATIVTDVPLEKTIEDLKFQEPDYDRLRTLLRDLEFRTMLKRLPGPDAASESPDAVTGLPDDHPTVELGVCRTVETQDELTALVRRLKSAGTIAVRTHTTSGKPSESQLIGIAFSTGPGQTDYVRLDGGVSPNHTATLAFDDDGPFSADLSAFREILESADIIKIGHDLKLDVATLLLKGIRICGLDFDTMLGAYVMNSARSSYAITDVAFEQLGMELPQINPKAKDKSLEPEVDQTICAETEAAWNLSPILREKLERDGLMPLMESVEMPLVPVLAEVELRGLAIDTAYLGELSVRLNDRIRELEHEIYHLAGHEFNIGSPKQLQTVLFEERQLPSGKKNKTGYSTDADTLEQLALLYPIVQHILEWREFSKLKSTYSDALPRLINPRTGRIHTSLNQAVATTGRLSSSDPNLQNIPVRTEIGREIRKAFIATGGNVLVSADYSQVELRILAHVTDDPELVRAFEADEDIHVHTASTLFSVPESEVTPEMRRRAKTVNFAVIYGMSDFGLAKDLGIATREAHEYIERYFARFPGVRRYTDETIEYAREHGFVTTLLGRRRYIPEIRSGNRNFRLFAERAAVNMPIQGTAADIMKIAMIRVDQALRQAGLATEMVLQVHDELVFEAPPGELDQVVGIVRKEMAEAQDLAVRLVVDVKYGKNWAEMEPVS